MSKKMMIFYSFPINFCMKRTPKKAKNSEIEHLF